MTDKRTGSAKVLFLDHRGAACSVMALGLARARASSLVLRCAGVSPADRVDADALRVMSGAGMDISDLAPTAVPDLDVEGFSLVVTLGVEAHGFCTSPMASWPAERSKVLSGMPVLLHWDVPDPGALEAGGDDPHETCLADLSSRVGALLDHGFLEALMQVHARWASLVDGLTDGVIAHDSSRRIFLFNRAAEELTGYGREEVIGRDCHTVFEPGGMCGSQCSFCSGCAPPGGLSAMLDYELDLTTRDGQDRHVRMSVKPLELDPGEQWGVIATLRDLTEVSRLRRTLAPENSFHGMVAVSPAMIEVFDTIRQIATSDYPVLVTGESGTGKELVAGAIHAQSRRSAGPFVPINCGALPDNILESELFGHVRGAFTGAVRTKKGRFEMADKGTLFLDEVGELSPSFQVKLLRVLQEKRFEMVGGERTVKVDVRVLSATNRDLREMVRQGTFREDLFYRLCVVPLALPPLRERTEDIPYLVEHALERIRETGVDGAPSVSDEAMALLVKHPWTGNVRELINALQFATVRCAGAPIAPEHLPAEIRVSHEAPARPRLRVKAPARLGRRPKLDPVSVKQAMERAMGNKVAAARLLGVGRATLYRFLKHGQ